MIGTEPKNCERLYLYKDNENDIYADNCQNLKQHQVDSLRFLYRQFKKKKHGAVLNFPPGSGKSLVVTLFLNAISSQLNERILIFCIDDEEMDHWKQLLLTWTNYKSDEIAVESPNPRLKKKIFLKKAEDINSYLRYNWGVVVIKDENMCKELKKVVLDAELKIWITSTDVKKDVELLLFIYNWMFPKSNININEVITNVKPQDKKVQSIIMDTFLEDFVIRENKVKVIKETKNSQELKLYRNQKGTTRKNKDATGNKIKKSKRTIDITPMEQRINLPDVNISTEEVKLEPKPLISGNDLTDLEDKSCAHNINLKTNMVEDEGNSLNLLQMNETQVKVERNTEESLNLKTENDIVVVEENSTESLNFGGEENLESTESLDFGDDNSDNHDNKDILYIEDKICNHDVKNIENDIKMDLDMNKFTMEKSETSNDLDSKMSEIEERTMKKFKGSLLDSLF